MFAKFIDKLTTLFTMQGTPGRIVRLGIFFALVIPVELVSWVLYWNTYHYLTEITLARRESIAHLASVSLKEKFDRVVDVGSSLASRVQFRQLVAQRKWEEAISLLKSIPTDFAYVDTVALFDPEGTIWAVTPPIPSVVGQNFSYRDYYQGVSKDWKPFVSEVFKRAVDPAYNVVAVAVPIKSDSVREADRQVLGILLLTINLDTILDWARDIEVGSGGFTYFVDRSGHVAGHPKYSSYGEVVDFSDVPAVQKALAGEDGIEVLYNQIEQEERVSAYTQVPGYGWGVIVQQPTLTAFAGRNQQMQRLLVVNVLTLLGALLFGYVLLRFINALNQYRQKQKIFLQSIGDGLVAIDRYWNVTLWNPMAERISGWSQAEVVGKPLRQSLKLVFEESGKPNYTFIEEAMLTGKVHQMVNHTNLITKDGKQIPLGDSAAPIISQNGQIEGCIIVFRDISKEHELEKARQDFINITTHQLRTPVGGIRGYLELLLGGAAQLSTEQRSFADQAYEITKRLGELVNALLNVSRIDAGALGITPEQVDPISICRQVVEEMRPMADELSVSLSLSGEPPSQTFNADPRVLRAILQNLLSNAVKYNRPGGQVAIKLVLTADEWKLEVTDTGLGIPSSQQPRVFEKFFRADNVRTLSVEGTGLGLYIVKAVVEQAGGTVAFTSVEGKGSTFIVRFQATGMRLRAGAKSLG